MIADGQLSFEGGMDSGKSPSLLDQNQSSWLVNTTARGGFLTHRPAINRKQIFQDSTDIEELLATGVFQGSGIYQDPNCGISLIASISGRILKFDLSNGCLVSDIGISGDTNSSALDKVYFQQAETFLIIQNGIQLPLIWDGATMSRSVVSARQVPTGGPMAYGMGRLWVAKGKSYVGSDLIGSNRGIEDIIYFTENTYLNEGGSFSVPSQQGDCAPITSLAFGSNIDTALGTGDLLVFTRGSIFAFNAPIDRDTWKNLQYPLQRFALLDYGSMNHDGVSTVNGDLFFRSQDGIRSFIYARRDFQQSWANTPISNEVERILRYDDENLLYAGSSCLFDNRLLMTAGPVRHARGIVHRGLAVLDFDLVSDMRDKLPPAWEGIWTGLQILQIHRFRLNGKSACWMFGVDETGTIGLWELTTDGRFDNGITPIQWVHESRAFNYQSPMARKRLLHHELWIQEAVGDSTVRTRFKSDSRGCWEDWDTYDVCADEGTCDSPDSYCGIRPVQPAVRSRMTSKQAINTSRGEDGPVAIGYEHQVRIEVTGSCTIRKYRLTADPVPDGIVGKVQP